MALDDLPSMDKLDDASKKELSEFINRESSNARLQTTIHELTSMCWDKSVLFAIEFMHVLTSMQMRYEHPRKLLL